MYEQGRAVNSNENGPINSLQRSGETKTATVILTLRRIEIQTQYIPFTRQACYPVKRYALCTISIIEVSNT
jgi:hypothetical protein